MPVMPPRVPCRHPTGSPCLPACVHRDLGVNVALADQLDEAWPLRGQANAAFRRKPRGGPNTRPIQVRHLGVRIKQKCREAPFTEAWPFGNLLERRGIGVGLPLVGGDHMARRAPAALSQEGKDLRWGLACPVSLG